MFSVLVQQKIYFYIIMIKGKKLSTKKKMWCRKVKEQKQKASAKKCLTLNQIFVHTQTSIKQVNIFFNTFIHKILILFKKYN